MLDWIICHEKKKKCWVTFFFVIEHFSEQNVESKFVETKSEFEVLTIFVEAELYSTR